MALVFWLNHRARWSRSLCSPGFLSTPGWKLFFAVSKVKTMVLLHFPLWLVGETQATFWTTQIQTTANLYLVSCVFPRFQQCACFHIEFVLTRCDFFFALIGRCDSFGFSLTTDSIKVRCDLSAAFSNYIKGSFQRNIWFESAIVKVVCGSSCIISWATLNK